MSEKIIRIVRLNSDIASGWCVEEDGSIRIEVTAPSWDTIEKKSKNSISIDMDHVLAEMLVDLFDDAGRLEPP